MFTPSTIITLGIIVIITPFLGLPTSWKTGILLIAGLLVVIGGYLYRKLYHLNYTDNKKSSGTQANAESFVESRPSSDNLNES